MIATRRSKPRALRDAQYYHRRGHCRHRARHLAHCSRFFSAGGAQLPDAEHLGRTRMMESRSQSSGLVKKVARHAYLLTGSGDD